MELEDRIRRTRNFASLFKEKLNRKNVFVFDLTDKNTELAKVVDGTVEQKDRYVKGEILRAGAKAGLGKYMEDRSVYRWSKKFDGGRSIHLGIDIFLPKGIELFAFADSVVHGFVDNDEPGDYGPTIILEHEIDRIKFYSLYGHLSRKSLNGKSEGMAIAKGDAIGRIGCVHENGSWPEHVHFQLMKRVGRHRSDFPGAASKSEIVHYRKVCMDPNAVLGIEGL